MAGLTIGSIARRAGLATDTVRYYEREGLLVKPTRTRAGYRQYPDSTVARLRFIRQAKELGFSLREIRELLALRVDARKSCGDVRQQALRKIAVVDQRIAQLDRVRQALARLVAECSGRGPTSACPILEALEREEQP